MPKRIIVQDNKIYEFEPGRNGHTTAHPTEPNSYMYKQRSSDDEGLIPKVKVRAKTIGPSKNVDVGSARG